MCNQFSGDSEALERIAYEISEDEVKEGVLYFELRFSPHLASNTIKTKDRLEVLPISDPNACSPKHAVESVLKGLKRAQNDFNVGSALILSCIRGHSGIHSNIIHRILSIISRTHV